MIILHIDGFKSYIQEVYIFRKRGLQMTKSQNRLFIYLFIVKLQNYCVVVDILS